MTATPFVPMVSVGGDADILAHMFGLLVEGRSATQISELLERAQGLINATSQSIKQRQALESRMSAVIIFLERGLPACSTETLQPRQRLMLAQAAEVCQEVVRTSGFDDYWRFVAMTLLAECTYLLGERHTALHHAEAAQQMLPLILSPTPTTETCAAYTQHMLRQTSELPVTSHSFLEQIQHELSSM